MATGVQETEDIKGDASGKRGATGEAETTRSGEACGSTKRGQANSFGVSENA